MLTIAIVIRYCLVIIGSLIWSFYLQRKSCKISHFSWNAWQAVFFSVCIRVLVGQYVETVLWNLTSPYISIFLDLCIWWIAYNIIERFALNNTIKQQSVQAMSQCFFINRITFVLLSASVLYITQFVKIMSDEFYNDTAKKLWLYEIPISVDAYINHVLVMQYNTQHSMQRILELLITHGLSCIGIQWFFANYYTMRLKYKYFFFVLTVGIITAWDMFLYNQCTLESISVLAVGTLGAMAVWWFYCGRQQAVKLDI